MSYSWHDFVGNIGVLFVLVSYLLLQLGKLSPASLWFSTVNGLGALFILVTLWFELNLSAFVVEAAWFLISLYGMWKSMQRDRSTQ